MKRIDENIIMGFNRLRIMDITKKGDQPLIKNNIYLIANAEIYNYDILK